MSIWLRVRRKLLFPLTILFLYHTEGRQSQRTNIYDKTITCLFRRTRDQHYYVTWNILQDLSFVEIYKFNIIPAKLTPSKI